MRERLEIRQSRFSTPKQRLLLAGAFLLTSTFLTYAGVETTRNIDILLAQPTPTPGIDFTRYPYYDPVGRFMYEGVVEYYVSPWVRCSDYGGCR